MKLDGITEHINSIPKLVSRSTLLCDQTKTFIDNTNTLTEQGTQIIGNSLKIPNGIILTFQKPSYDFVLTQFDLRVIPAYGNYI